ncbi:rhombosortase [Glaciecola siphonariae]|uniref:Rhombosortase n=1 Tax=Glaciecola siphonariae TaxID=521012 RepID=A0ABV9LST9_9ALTE
MNKNAPPELAGAPRKMLVPSSVLAICIGLLCIAVALLPAHIQAYFVLSDAGISKWQLWRLITAHFTHTNLWHLGLNLVGLALIWLLFIEQLSWRYTLFTVAICTAGLSVLLIITNGLSDILWYAGLSGTLHGLFAFAVALELKHKRLSTFVLIGLGCFKLSYEQLGGSTQDTADLIGANVAIDAHLWGAVLGVFCAVIVLTINLVKHKTQKRR